MYQEDLQTKTPRKHLNQMPEPHQLAPTDMKEQWTTWSSLWMSELLTPTLRHPTLGNTFRPLVSTRNRDAILRFPNGHSSHPSCTLRFCPLKIMNRMREKRLQLLIEPHYPLQDYLGNSHGRLHKTHVNWMKTLKTPPATHMKIKDRVHCFTERA